MKTYDISAGLTVTVHDDGYVHWHSATPMTLYQVRGAVWRKRERYLQQVAEQEEVLKALHRSEEQNKP